MKTRLLGWAIGLCGVVNGFGQQPAATIQFSAPAYSVAEDAGTAVIVVLRTGETNNVVSVDYATSDGTANAASDYNAQSGTLKFASGESEKTFRLQILDDGLVEGDETVLLALSNVSEGAILGSQASAVLTIEDNEFPTWLDTTFHPALEDGTGVITPLLQPDGKILLGGQLSSEKGEWDGNRIDVVVRLNPDGTRDSTFARVRSPFPINPPGPGTTYVNPMALQADGKVVIGGVFSTLNGIPRENFARLNADGSVDLTFTTSVHGAIDPSADYARRVESIVVQPDGKIVIGGLFVSINGVARHGLARVNPDGSVDTAFADAGINWNEIRLVALQSSGKILIIGESSVNFSLVRLNSDGTLDQGFTTQAALNVLQQPDGKLLTNQYGGCPQRLNVDGSIDPSFSTCENEKLLGLDIRPLAVRADGRILAQTWHTPPASGFSLPGLVLLNSDASLAQAYPFPGVTFTRDSSVGAGAFARDGSALIAGNFAALKSSGIPPVGLARVFFESGPPAFQFSSPSIGVAEDGTVATVVVQRSGNSSGTASVDFTTVNGSAQSGQDFQSQSGTLFFAPLETAKDVSIPILDNALLSWNTSFSLRLSNASTGTFLGVGPRSATVTIHDAERLGSVDWSFDPRLELSDPLVLLQPDGKLIVGGYLTTTNPVTGLITGGVARLNADGSLDPTFQLSVPFALPPDWRGQWREQVVYALAAQADGKLLVGGSVFLTLNGEAQVNMARLYPNGTLDTGFHAHSAVSRGIVRMLAIQPDGKILLAQQLSDTNGSPHPAITRLDPDGDLDRSFDMGLGVTKSIWPPAINAILPLADGRILIAGDFWMVGGTARNSIARLHPDGSVDESFDPGAGATPAITSMALQPDGRIMIVGDFDTFDHSVFGGIARLNSDGSVDNTFKGFGQAGGVRVDDRNLPVIVALQPDGRMLIAGSLFSSLKDGNPLPVQHGVARLNADGTLDTTFDAGLGVYDYSGNACCDFHQPTVSTLVALPNGSVLAGGNFTSFDGVARAGLVRLHGDRPPRFAGISALGLTLSTLPGRRYLLEASGNLANWSPWRTNTATGYLLNLDTVDAGNLDRRFYRAHLLSP